MKPGDIHRIDGRNFQTGVWTGDGWIGIRFKFGSRFLDFEDRTVSGVHEYLGATPGDVPLTTRTGTVCGNCDKPAIWTGPPSPAPWKCESGCEKVDPVARHNDALFDILKQYSPTT